jgi:hypothetical protein
LVLSFGIFEFAAEIIGPLRAPIWGDLCMTKGRACIEDVGYSLVSNGRQSRVRIVELEASVKAEAQKVYIIWEI